MGESVIVCGKAGASGVTYAEVNGSPVTCGADSNGNVLQLQVASAPVGDSPVEGGEQVGLDIGAAVLLVMAGAWCIRVLRRMIESSGGDGF